MSSTKHVHNKCCTCKGPYLLLISIPPILQGFLSPKKALSNIYLSPILKKDVMALTFNPSTSEAKAGRRFGFKANLVIEGHTVNPSLKGALPDQTLLYPLNGDNFLVLQ